MKRVENYVHKQNILIMETRINHLGEIYAKNVKGACDLYSWLEERVKARIDRQKEVSVQYLAECKTMKTIIRIVCKIMEKYDGVVATKEEKKALAAVLATKILNEAN